MRLKIGVAFLLALLIFMASVSAQDVTAAERKQLVTQMAMDQKIADAQIVWLRTLHTFQHASLKNVGDQHMTISRLTGQYDNVAVEVSDFGGELIVDLFVRKFWTDADTVLLQAIAKHVAGEPKRPVTPEMAIRVVQGGVPITEYLANGKLLFDHMEEHFDECPWKDDCYIADIRVTPH